MSNATAQRPGAALRPAARGPRLPRRAALLAWPAGLAGAVLAWPAGLAGAVLAFLWSWNPSYWGDEAASVMSAQRPLPTLWAELGRVDAVHGAYYLFLHLWIDLFGASELSTRLPSAIAVGVAVAGVVLLCRRLFGTRVAVLAAVVFAVLPRTDSMGAEARSYAINTAIAVWLTLLLVVLMARRERRPLPWLGYAALLGLGVTVFLYLVLLLPVYGLALLGTRRGRRMLRRWLLASACGLLLAAPVLCYGLSQHGQITFLAHRGYATPQRILVVQWFGDDGLAVLCWLFVAVAAVAGAIRLRRGHAAVAPTVLIGAWFALPTAILLAGNAWVAPMYTVRYLSFCAPAAAIVVALGIDAAARSVSGRLRIPVAGAVTLVATALVVVLAAPTDIAQRGAYAKDDGSDLRQTSAVVAAHARPGDAIVFDQSIRNSRKPRLALHLYPGDYAGLDDVGLETPYDRLPGLWDRVLPVDRIGSRLATATTVWAVESRAAADPLDLRSLRAQGFRVVHSYPVHRTTVYELTRETA